MDSALKTPGILYLHGFRSSPASWKARLLAEEMANRGLAAHFLCPQLPPVPDEALAGLCRLIEKTDKRLTLVGSSLGGHYASCLAEKYDLNAVLINPAIISRLDLSLFIGEHSNLYSGESFIFTEAHAKQLSAQVVSPSAERYWLMVEEADEVLDFQEALTFYTGCRQTVLTGGNHSFTKFPQYISQIIEFAEL